MTVRVKVVDRLNRSVAGCVVRVNWGGSSSNERTSSSGIADLNCSPGTAKGVYIDDKQVDSDCYLHDGINSYSHPLK